VLKRDTKVWEYEENRVVFKGKLHLTETEDNYSEEQSELDERAKLVYELVLKNFDKGTIMTKLKQYINRYCTHSVYFNEETLDTLHIIPDGERIQNEIAKTETEDADSDDWES
jgi:hypothetical protein